MFRITTKIDCDSCKRTIEIDVEAIWDFKNFKNVILTGVGDWLEDAGWMIDAYTDEQFCPDCKEVSN